MLSRIHACSQKRKWKSELTAALPRAWPHLGMSSFLCGWRSVSRLPLIDEEGLFSCFSGLLKECIDFLTITTCLKVSVMKCFSKLSCFSELILPGPCGYYQSTLACLWRNTVRFYLKLSCQK